MTSVTQQIKNTLIAKGYPVGNIGVLRGNDVGETEWFFSMSEEHRNIILKHGDDYFYDTDFDSDNNLWGNRECIGEMLEFLPNLYTL